MDARLGQRELRAPAGTARAHPFLQVLAGVANLAQQADHVGKEGLVARAVAKVGIHRLQNLLVMVDDGLAQALQRLDALLVAGRTGAQEGGAQRLELRQQGVVLLHGRRRKGQPVGVVHGAILYG